MSNAHGETNKREEGSTACVDPDEVRNGDVEAGENGGNCDVANIAPLPETHALQSFTLTSPLLRSTPPPTAEGGEAAASTTQTEKPEEVRDGCDLDVLVAPPHHREQQPRTQYGEEAAVRSLASHPSAAVGAVCDAEIPSSVVLNESLSPQEAASTLPLLVQMTDLRTERTTSSTLTSVKQLTAAVPPSAGTHLPPPQVVTHAADGAPVEPRCRAVACAAFKATSTASPSSSSPSPRAWVSCAHSDLPARYRDTPGLYCTYCSYTVCTDCLPQKGFQVQLRATKIDAPPPAASPSLPPSSSSLLLVASPSTAAGKMDWLDAVIASPATDVHSGKILDSNHATDAAAAALCASDATAVASSSASPLPQSKTAPLRCHLCRHGVLVRGEALLHEWCCEGPAPAARLHSGGENFIYETSNLQKYHHMRAQREARMQSTEPLIAQVLDIQAPDLEAHVSNGRAKDLSAPCVTQNPLEEDPHGPRGAPRTVSDKKKGTPGRDPLPYASPMHGQRAMRSNTGTATVTAACSRNDAAPSPLACCEEGGSFTFSVWNPRTEVQLVWCAVNREAREDAPTRHVPYQHSSAEHRGGAVLPSSASVTPLFTWCCPPSLPGLPARPFRVVVPYGLYAFAKVHALVLYMAKNMFDKACTQLAASTVADSDGAKNVRLSSVKILPASTLRALLTVKVLHHVATTPVPLRLGRGLLPAIAAPRTQHNRPDERRPMQPQSSPKGADGATPGLGSHKRPREGAESSDGGRSTAAPETGTSALSQAPHLQWPRGLASTELALCVDHLLQGRSIAVYGIGSKHFFLHHVAQSAELKHLQVVTVDASLGRGRGGDGSGGATTSTTGDPQGPGPRGRRLGGIRAAGGAAGSLPIERQLVNIGITLTKRVRLTALKAEVPLKGDKTTAARRPGRQQEMHGPHQQKSGSADEEVASLPLERAALLGEANRSPAMARDVTLAMLRPQATSRTARMLVDVVDVDESSSESAATHSRREASEDMLNARGMLPCGEGLVPSATPAPKGMSTPNKSVWKSQQHQREHPSPLALMCTPSSQRGTRLSSAPPSSSPATNPVPLLSPVPAFFEVLQQTVKGSLVGDSVAGADGKEGEGNDTPPPCVCEELLEYAGGPHLPKLPPLPFSTPTQRGDTALEITCSAPRMRFADEAVRQLALKSVRRQQTSRRCVQWVSLPSTTASAVLAEQMPNPATTSLPPRLHLLEAHMLRPGWSPPLLLVLHNVDLLDTEEATLLVQLCAAFAYPHPHLQLLVSFDDPRWPLTPLAGALERMGLCAVQLRSLLLPRVHEMASVSSMRLLSDSEAAASGGAGSLGLKAMRYGASATSGASGTHLLHDTMCRVLFSLPQAFSGLLRILVDVQEEVGEGHKISLFLAKDRFEQHGVMVSQGRLKALLQELTSNRIVQYDAAEHALIVMQPRKLRTVLDEVTAQRDAAAASPPPANPPPSH